MALHIHPSALRFQRFLLKHKADSVFLFVGQGIVAAEALGDVHTLRLWNAAHLQHVAVKIAVDIAIGITRFVSDQETVVGGIPLIIHIFPVQELIRSGGHLQVVNGILADRESVSGFVQSDGYRSVFSGRKRDLFPCIRSGEVNHRAHVGIEQAEYRPFKPALHMSVRVGEQIDAVHAARTGNIRAGRGNGPGLLDRGFRSLGKLTVYHIAHYGRVIETYLRTDRPRNTCGIGDGHSGSVGNGIGAGMPADIVSDRISRVRSNGYRAVVDGLIVAECVLQKIGQAFARQGLCSWIYGNLIGGKVSIEGGQFLGKHILRPRVQRGRFFPCAVAVFVLGSVGSQKVIILAFLQHRVDRETAGLELNGFAVQGDIHRLHLAGFIVKVQYRNFFFRIHRRADQQNRHLDILRGLIMYARRRIHQADVEGSGKAEVRRGDAELRGALVDIVPIGIRAEDQLFHRKLRSHREAAVGGIVHADLIGIAVRGNQGSGEHNILDRVLLLGRLFIRVLLFREHFRLCLLTRFLLGGEHEAEGEAARVKVDGPVFGTYKSVARFPEEERIPQSGDIGQAVAVDVVIQADPDVPGIAKAVISVVKIRGKGLAVRHSAGYRSVAHRDMQRLRRDIERAGLIQQRHVQQHQCALVILCRARVRKLDEHGPRRHGLGQMPADLDRHMAVGIYRLDGRTVKSVPDRAAPEHGLFRVQELVTEGHLVRADRKRTKRKLLRRSGVRSFFGGFFLGLFRGLLGGFFVGFFCGSFGGLFRRFFGGLFRSLFCLVFFVFFRFPGFLGLGLVALRHRLGDLFRFTVRGRVCRGLGLLRGCRIRGGSRIRGNDRIRGGLCRGLCRRLGHLFRDDRSRFFHKNRLFLWDRIGTAVRVHGGPVGINRGAVGIHGCAVRIYGNPVRGQGCSVGVDLGSIRIHGNSVGGQGRAVGIHLGSVRIHGDPIRGQGRAVGIDRRPVRIHGGSVRVQCRAVRIHLGSVRIYGDPVGGQGRSVGVDRRPVRIYGRAVRLQCRSVGVDRRPVRIHGAAVRVQCRSVGIDRGAVRIHGAAVRVQGRSVHVDNGSVGIGPGAVGIYNCAVSINRGAVRVHRGAVRIHRDTVGPDRGPVGIDNRPVGIEDGSVGVDGGSVGVNGGSVGIHHLAVGIDHGAVRIDDGAVCIRRGAVGAHRGAVGVDDCAVGIYEAAVRVDGGSVRQDRFFRRLWQRCVSDRGRSK